MKIMKIGLVQAPAGADREENGSRLMTFARQAKADGCCCICFPEAFLTGYAPEQAAFQSICRKDPLLDQTAAAAVSLGIDILAGFMESDAGKYYICHGVFLADGRQAFYRKTHLGEKEALYFSAGDHLPVFTLSCGVPIGIQLCVEGHYPDITQTLSLRGAQVIFVPHAVPRAAGNRKEIWEKYIPCRSYDNRVVMACCNLWDEHQFCGGCLATDERGTVLSACFEEGCRLLTFDLFPEQLQKYREKQVSARYRYFPGLRRRELYE